jgi:hypothetical protein
MEDSRPSLAEGSEMALGLWELNLTRFATMHHLHCISQRANDSNAPLRILAT